MRQPRGRFCAGLGGAHVHLGRVGAGMMCDQPLAVTHMPLPHTSACTQHTTYTHAHAHAPALCMPGSCTCRYVMEDRFSAIRAAIGTAGPGDAVVILGRGHRDYMEYGSEDVSAGRQAGRQAGGQ